MRTSIFETSSSSVHCVNINRVNVDYSFTPPKDGVIGIEPGEFGWEFETYANFYSKASYAYTYAKNYDTSDGNKMKMLESVIKNFTKCDVVFLSTGYIDHQSIDTAGEVFKDEETLKNFLFNKYSSFSTGNDNC